MLQVLHRLHSLDQVSGITEEMSHQWGLSPVIPVHVEVTNVTKEVNVAVANSSEIPTVRFKRKLI